jgi:antirestriction protein ArdC
MPTQTEIRSAITASIVEALTNGGLPPWKRPWADDPNVPGLHTSLSTGSPYRGINQLILQVAGMKHGFRSKWWGTFNQVRFNGSSVRKGEKATRIVLWKPIKRTRANERGEETDDNFLVMREFSVFNAEQTSGLDRFRVGFAQKEPASDLRYEIADAVIDGTGAEFRFGGNQAYYSPESDVIQMPFRNQFESTIAFYETSFHELCHWSERRTGFDRSQVENTYALGELVAEIGSCFLMGELNLPTTDNLGNHASYLSHWLKGMSDDPKFIFRAAAQASKAADFIMSFSRTSVEETVLA